MPPIGLDYSGRSTASKGSPKDSPHRGKAYEPLDHGPAPIGPKTSGRLDESAPWITGDRKTPTNLWLPSATWESHETGITERRNAFHPWNIRELFEGVLDMLGG